MVRRIGSFAAITLVLILSSSCDQFSARVAAVKGFDAYAAAVAASSSQDPDVVKTAPGLYQAAVEYYEDAHASLPQSDVLLQNLAFAYLAMSRFPVSHDEGKKAADRAISLLIQCVDKNPKNLKLMGVLLGAFNKNDRLPEAVKYFQGRLDKTPNDLNLLMVLKTIQADLKNFAAVVDLLEKRKALNPNDGQVYISIAEACWRWLTNGVPTDPGPEAVEQKGYEAAIEANKRLPKSDSALVYGEQILVQRAKREDNGSRETFKRTIDILQKRRVISPNDVQVHVRIAENALKWLSVKAPKDDAGTIQVATEGYDAAMKAAELDPKIKGQIDDYAGRLLRWRASGLRESNPDAAKQDDAKADVLLHSSSPTTEKSPTVKKAKGAGPHGKR